LAIAPTEVYRVLVNAISPGANMPVETSLPDYAGFRYDADPRAAPTRWPDTSSAAIYARQPRDVLAAKIIDTVLQVKLDPAVSKLSQLATAQSSAGAKPAAKG